MKPRRTKKPSAPDKKRTPKKKQPAITADMSILEIVNLCPESTDIMLSYGLHCIGCSVSAYETLAEGAMVHGFTQGDMKHLLREINQVYKKQEATRETEKERQKTLPSCQ